MKALLQELTARLLEKLDDETFVKMHYLYKHKKFLNLNSPSTFNEKINFLKLNDRSALRSKITDRLWVRDYVKSLSPECELIPLLWTGTVLDFEIYESLPQEFVLKANHGSKMVKIVNKETDDFPSLQGLCQQWLNKDYYLLGREKVYQNLEKYLIIEEKLADGKSDVPPDFKLHCFNGKVEIIQVDSDRFKSHRRNLYGRDFAPIDAEYGFKKGELIPKPKRIELAIAIAEKIAVEFNYIRVDLFLINEKVYFGELTNFPDNGMARFYPSSFDLYFGEKLKF